MPSSKPSQRLRRCVCGVLAALLSLATTVPVGAQDHLARSVGADTSFAVVVPQPADGRLMSEIRAHGVAVDVRPFTAAGAVPRYGFGSAEPGSVRDWIGRSTCPACVPEATQELLMHGLAPGSTYFLTVYPRYVSSPGDYLARISSGSASLQGGTRSFAHGGITRIGDAWRMVLVPTTSNLTLEIGAAPGGASSYMYVDGYAFWPTLPGVGNAFAVDTPHVESGPFQGTAGLETYVADADGPTRVRPWIGVSNCPGCPVGQPQTQRIVFDHAVPGARYWVTLTPRYVTPGASFGATISSGVAVVESGASRAYHQPLQTTEADAWSVSILANDTRFSVDLGGVYNGSTGYMYFKTFEYVREARALSDPQVFGEFVKTRDTLNGGAWWKDQLATAAGHYEWGEAYVLLSYVETYAVTHDAYWLDRFVDHADAALAQTDRALGRADYRGRTGPVWQEPSSRFVWAGFSGAMYLPMLKFARLVQDEPALQSTDRLATAAQTYVAAATEAVEFHTPEWHVSAGQGVYAYPADMPGATNLALRRQTVAWDLNALMMSLQLEISDYLAAGGASDRAGAYRASATAYAEYFLQHALKLEASPDGPRYIWNFSQSSPRTQDIGHGNFDVQFMLACYARGIVFNNDQILAVAHTFDGLIDNAYAIPRVLIDGGDIAGLSKPAFLWHALGSMDPVARRKSMGFVETQALPLRDLVTMGVLKWAPPAR